MPAVDSPSLIVARYLKANNYTQSYQAFIDEAGLPDDAGDASRGYLTLETLLEEKKAFDISTRFEKLGVNDGASGWSQPAPTIAQEIESLPSTSNILSVRLKGSESNERPPILLASTADRRLDFIDAKSGSIEYSLTALHDSPILSCAIYRKEYLLTASMSGQLILSTLRGEVLEKRRNHSKYIVKVALLDTVDERNNVNETSETLVATAGWDSKICVYQVSNAAEPRLGEPVATIQLPTKPEAMVFVTHPDTLKPLLLISRTDSSCIFYYTVEPTPRLLGKQNLAPHSNAWVAFTPAAFELCPTDPSLLAVATSTVPHMKLLIVRLLFPPWDGDTAAPPPPATLRTSLLDDTPATLTQASQARAALAVADREADAIQIHCTTMAPQTPYSTPAVAWRPDGSGVWVNGDDGAVRGIEASSGKVVSTLHGHEAGSKVRCVCAGRVGEDEVLVSGGFDQKLIVWRP